MIYAKKGEIVKNILKLPKLKILGFDIGSVFVGVAISNDLFSNDSLRPLITLNRKDPKFTTKIQNITKDASAAIVGWPMDDRGKEA